MKKLFYALLIVSSLNASAKISKTKRTKSLLTEKIEKTFSKSLSKKDIKLAKEEVLKYKGKAVPALINIMKNEKFPEAQKVENCGFFIGLHTKHIQREALNKLVNTLLKIDNI